VQDKPSLNSETIWIKPQRLLTERRLDLIIKTRLWRHFLSEDDPGAVDVYVEHIAKRAGTHKPISEYLPAAIDLFRSMKANGFDKRHPVPVNRHWGLLGGAHRVSCALVLGLDVLVDKLDTDHEWPPWGREWFEKHGMAIELPWVESLLEDLRVEPSARQSTPTGETFITKGTRAEGSPLLMGTDNA